jgi:hypothetical protein
MRNPLTIVMNNFVNTQHKDHEDGDTFCIHYSKYTRTGKMSQPKAK